MANVGNRQATGVLDPANPFLAGGWTITFDQSINGWNNDVEIFHMALMGPTISNFLVYVGTTFYDSVFGPGFNSWDPNQPLLFTKGQILYFYFNTTTGPAPVISLFAREPRLSDQL